MTNANETVPRPEAACGERESRAMASDTAKAPRPLRIAVFAKSKSRTLVARSIADALARAGHRVRTINEGQRRRLFGRKLAILSALASVRRLQPDFVFVFAQDCSSEVFSALSGDVPVVMFTPDCWPSPVLPEHLRLAAGAELLCTVAPGQIAELERAGARRVAYLAEAHDPRFHHPVEDADPAFVSEVAFIGRCSGASPMHATRRALLEAVAPRFDAKLYGRGWSDLGLDSARAEVFPVHYRQICRGADIVLGCDWRHDVAGYFSNRTWFTLGCRGFLLTNYCPELERVFENHRQLVWYRSVDECLELIEHYRKRPAERSRIAAEGHAYALAHRTFDHFAKDLVDLFEGREPDFPPRSP